jgi:hypothetical protein
MSYIDASRLAEFLDKNKNRKLDRNSLRTDVDLLKKAGVSILEESRKFGRKIRTLEYFLLRSHLYRPEGDYLAPNLISSSWHDYAKSWKTEIDGHEIHLPFLGKIAFLCKVNGALRIVCHPDSASLIEKICVDTGILTFQKDPDKVNLMYKAKKCEAILHAYKHKKLTEEFLQNVGNSPFGRALLSIGLAKKEGEAFSLVGDNLLLTELKKLKEDDDLEKVARLIVRNEQRRQAQISSIIVCLEFFERQKHPSESPVGSGSRYWESKRTKKKYERLGHYEVIEGYSSLDSRVASNIFTKTGGTPGFAAFGAFLDTYNRVETRLGQDWVDTFVFLSWYTDSVAYLAAQSETLGKRLGWPDFKTLKTRRHKSFLLRFIKDEAFHITSQKDVASIQLKSRSSEIIDMNTYPEKFLQLCGGSKVEYCPSNVFLTSKVPVDRELFETSVLSILQSPSRFRDAQGAFYYPDFRFLVASTLGLSLKGVDQILAYVISTGSELGRRLWFFPAFGRVPERDRPDQQLTGVVLRPFDSITLNY